jgi:5S rRNA maturation endonuclease (ribonuclease M5)
MNSNLLDGKITTTATNINKTKRQTNTEILKELLEDRLQAVRNDESLLTTGRWTQSTVYYTFRLHIDKLIKDGVNVKLTTRKHITDSIKDICDKKGYKRHELGIIAAARAQLYFRGKTYGVGFDEISKLTKLGTDLIIIEKEGAVEVLGPFADKQGIALLYTRGFASEYADEVSKGSKSNIAILTDFDASGLLIANKLSNRENIYWIGIRPEMVKDLGIQNIEEVEEEYTPQKGHYNTLKKIATATNISPDMSGDLILTK